MEYFLLKPDGEQTGTYSLEQIQLMLKSGFIDSDCRYWHEGISDWQSITRIDESLLFVPPHSDQPKTSPGSAKKIPGIPKGVPPAATKLAKLTAPARPEPVPERLPPPRTEPVPARRQPLPARFETPTLPREATSQKNPLSETTLPPPPAEEPTETVPEAAAVESATRSRTGFTTYLLYAVPVLLLAAAIIFWSSGSRQPASASMNQIIITDKSNYVLTDQATIKSFEQDLLASSSLQSLQAQLNQTTDPVIIQKLTLEIEKERVQNEQTVHQQYIQDSKAQLIDPGTYAIVAFFDEDGRLVMPQEGNVWVGFKYRGQIVYALKTAEPAQP